MAFLNEANAVSGMDMSSKFCSSSRCRCSSSCRRRCCSRSRSRSLYSRSRSCCCFSQPGGCGRRGWRGGIDGFRQSGSGGGGGGCCSSLMSTLPMAAVIPSVSSNIRLRVLSRASRASPADLVERADAAGPKWPGGELRALCCPSVDLVGPIWSSSASSSSACRAASAAARESRYAPESEQHPAYHWVGIWLRAR